MARRPVVKFTANIEMNLEDMERFPDMGRLLARDAVPRANEVPCFIRDCPGDKTTRMPAKYTPTVFSGTPDPRRLSAVCKALYLHCAARVSIR